MSITWNDVMKFDLKPNPTIFDVGGYKGDWVQIALNKYPGAKIYVFEPVTAFYNEIVERYKDNLDIKIYNFGLSDEDREMEISIEGDSSSVYKDSQNKEKIILKNIINFIKENQIYNVDLIKINIEGEEYRLLEYLTLKPELNIFNNFLVQFHNFSFIENCEQRRNEIKNRLQLYYNCLFDYEFVFEGWEMKKIQKINCFGDSHISIFSNSEGLVDCNSVFNNENFSIYRFGPILAYNTLSKGEVLEKINTIKDENILICFGEIDCRAQVHRFISEEKDYKTVIGEIINNYFSMLDKIENKKIILFSITPELKEQPHWYYYEKHPEVFDAPKGTYQERRKYKEYFNYLVEQESLKRGFSFVSIYNYLVKENTTKEEFFLDDIHLMPKKVNFLIKRELILKGF